MKYCTHVLVLVCAGVLFSPSASAYYHFLRYASRTGPFVPIPAKYDLNALPNKTLNFYISETGPASLAANDTLTGVLSQIRLAARVWNDVDSSDLRLAFGGMAPAGGPTTGPGIDVVFSDDIPPGLVAQGGVTSFGDIRSADGSFVPINRSMVRLQRNMADRPSYGEAFFLTMVHEIGHALGLQHTLTSSVMSTEITRATTKAKPLGADDIAGISTLYPARNFVAQMGSIVGQVTLSGVGVGLASVVALPPSGTAVSTITNPDGTYRIDGIPPGQYFVYVHPLPAALQGESSPANITAPLGPDGRDFAFSGAFDTQFFGNTKTAQVALPVTAGGVIENVNFAVQRRNFSPISSVQTYGFMDQVTTKPPMMNRNLARGLLVAAGVGLLTSGAVTPGLTITPTSGSASLAAPPRPYATSPSYVQMDFNLNSFSVEGPQHLIFGASNDIYVLPSAFQVTGRPAPSIASVTGGVDANGARVVTIAGSNLDKDTRFLFDGYPAAVRSVDDVAGRAVVSAPPAPTGHRASVVALNSDGQSSLLVQGNNVSSYVYESSDVSLAQAPGGPALTVTPASLTAGTEAMVEVTGPGLSLIDGLARLGFGNSEITVRKVWVTGPNRLLANIGVSGVATLGTTTVTVANGLQTVTLPAGFSVQAANPRQITILPQAVNPVTGQQLLTAGGAALVFAVNLPAGLTPATLTLTLNDQPVTATGVTNGQVTFVIPPATPSGAAVFRLRTATDVAPPIVLNIEPPPPVAVSVLSGGAAVDATRPVSKGDLVTVLVNNLVFDAYTGFVNASGVTVNVGGVDHTVQVVASGTVRGAFEVNFTLSSNANSGAQTLTVTQDGRTSAAVNLPVR